MLDLVDDRFFLLDGDDADVLAWLTARSPDLNLVRMEHEPTDGTTLVRAAIEPYEPAVTLLDTGGKRTRFTTTAFPGEVDGPLRSSGRGVGASRSTRLSSATGWTDGMDWSGWTCCAAPCSP